MSSMSAWSMCPRVNAPNACQFLIITCQRANKHANVPKACQSFNFVCQKAYQFFNCFSIFGIFSHFHHVQISRIFGQFQKTYLAKKRIVNLKPLTSFSIEHVGSTEQLFGQCKMELNIFFIYLILYAMCKQTYLEKYTSCTP